MRLPLLSQYVQDWIKDYNNGLSVRQIATKYGVSKSSVQKYLAQNIELRTINETQIGSKNSNWRGTVVSSWGLHKWVRGTKQKPETCDRCKLKPPLDLANISPTYNSKTYTRNLKNWWWLCRGCHMEVDGRLDKLHKIQEKSSGNESGTSTL